MLDANEEMTDANHGDIKDRKTNFFKLIYNETLI